MVTFLTIYVVPRMSNCFRFGNELPVVTQIVVEFSRWMSSDVFWLHPPRNRRRDRIIYLVSTRRPQTRHQ
jgi:hypothetical protein